MQADFVQRWRVRVPRYRPAGECIDTRAYDVVELRHDTDAKAFVQAHHYSGTYPAARFRFGLMRGAHLVGVAVFTIVSAGVCTAFTVSVSVGDVTVPLLTEAMLVTDPASRSAWVIV